MVPQRSFSTLIVAVAVACLAAAHASPPSATALESQAQTEFAKVGAAVRERLDREAAGDWIGARIAAKDAEAHRFRFLDIKRELSRLHPPSLAPPSVEAPRDPFVPDASFFAPSASSAIRVAPVTAGRSDAVIRVEDPAWDMYRPHESQDSAGSYGAQRPASRATPAAAPVGGAGDMYSPGVAKPHPARRARPAG